MGEREEALRPKIDDCLQKGRIHPSHSPWVSQASSFPSQMASGGLSSITGTQLHGHGFPLPVIEDMRLRQQGNRLWTLLDLEDIFDQMPLIEDSRQYTASCIPCGVFE